LLGAGSGKLGWDARLASRSRSCCMDADSSQFSGSRGKVPSLSPARGRESITTSGLSGPYQTRMVRTMMMVIDYSGQDDDI